MNEYLETGFTEVRGRPPGHVLHICCHHLHPWEQCWLSLHYLLLIIINCCWLLLLIIMFVLGCLFLLYA